MKTLQKMLCAVKNNLLVVLFFAIVGILALGTCVGLLHAYTAHEAIDNQPTEGQTQFEADLDGSVLGKRELLDLNIAVRSLMGQREINGIVKLNNGYLALPNGPLETEQAEQIGDSVQALQQQLADRGIEFLYMMVPFKVSKVDSELPVGITDDTNDAMDKVSAAFAARGVHCLNLRDSFDDSGDPYTYFYRTDHHWNTEGGYFAFTQLAPQLESLLDVTIDPVLLNSENYTRTVYPNWHLGYYGQRTGKFFAGIDDFTLIEPDFATEITNMGTGETGPFAQILVNPDALQTRDTNSRMTYDNVMGRSFGWFRNENAANDKKLLIIGDSMMKAVNPYLALSFREIRCMDNYEVGDKLTDEFLQEYQPDLVLMEHYPSHLYNTQPFNFALQ